jgi:hypothetical protein
MSSSTSSIRIGLDIDEVVRGHVAHLYRLRIDALRDCARDDVTVHHREQPPREPLSVLNPDRAAREPIRHIPRSAVRGNHAIANRCLHEVKPRRNGCVRQFDVDPTGHEKKHGPFDPLLR